MGTVSVSWPEIHAFRLHRHHLDRPAARTKLVAVVRDTCGIQAQLPSAAELSLRARVRGLRREDVTRALEKVRTLVRGWTVRFAVHVIPAEDFLLYTRALHARIRRDLAWMKRRGRSAAELEAIIQSIAEAVAKGPLTRRILADRVASTLGERARPWIQHGWGGRVVHAGLRGLVCFGPARGNEITFVSRERWLPDVRDFAPEEAAGILLRRYLRAFGPATQQDFQRWAEIPMADVRAMWDAAEGDLIEVRVDGLTGWILEEDLPSLRRQGASRSVVRLLPSFDTYLLGHREKGHLVDRAHYKRVYRKAGWLSPAVLVDGRVAGVWEMDRRANRAGIRVEPFTRLSRGVREGIESEADDIGRFLERTAEVSVAATR